MMDTKKLRQKVLDLAIRGKLVPQDPNDEPASVLLERIRKEKELLIKEGKIKRDKKENTCAKFPYENLPFELPESWGWCRLGEIAKIGTGATPLTSNSSYYVDGKIAWVNSSATNNTFITYPSAFITEKALLETNCSIYPIGTLLVAMYGEGKTRGQISELKIEAATNQACAAIQLFFREDALINYVKYCFQNNYEMLRMKSKGGNQPNLNLSIISNFHIPLPPLSELFRILKLIESAFALIDEIETNKLSLSQFIKQTKSKVLDLAIQGKLVPQDPNDEPASVLLERIRNELKAKKTAADISHYDELPKGWIKCKLCNIGKWSAGTTPSRTNKKYYENARVPWLKTGDLNDGVIINVSEYVSEYAMTECKQLKLNPIGSVVIALYGATIGKCGILDIETTTNQACCVCKTYPTILNKYLFFFLLSHREQFKSKAEGGAQPNISKEKIENSYIPLPPLSEQHRIVKKIEATFQILDSIEINL